MLVHSYPLLLSLYKGEGHILIVPLIDHIVGYSIDAEWYENVSDTDNASEVGNSVLRAVDYIRNSPLSSLTPKEREETAAWKKNTRYKSKVTFWKNYHYVRIKITEDSQYIIHSMKKSEKRQGAYTEIIKEVVLPIEASAEEIGESVIDTFVASEKFYGNSIVHKIESKKEIMLLDGNRITVELPWNDKWTDFQDGGSAEIYQSYCYIPQEGADSSAEIFLGIASELDCCLEQHHIYEVWTEMHGSSDYFDVQSVQCGIFSLRAELKNKDVHKISYFMQMEDDLLLECSMELHQPNRRKKLDDKLNKEFEEFSANCKFI